MDGVGVFEEPGAGGGYMVVVVGLVVVLVDVDVHFGFQSGRYYHVCSMCVFGRSKIGGYLWYFGRTRRIV